MLSSGALAACGNGSEEPVTSERPQSTVTIRSFDFLPARIEVGTGDHVAWVNEDAILHTVTSGVAGQQGVPGVSEDLPPSPDGMFDLELDGKASTEAFIFEDPGTFAYYCAIHSGMSGTVHVS